MSTAGLVSDDEKSDVEVKAVINSFGVGTWRLMLMTLFILFWKAAENREISTPLFGVCIFSAIKSCFTLNLKQVKKTLLLTYSRWTLYYRTFRKFEPEGRDIARLSLLEQHDFTPFRKCIQNTVYAIPWVSHATGLHSIETQFKPPAHTTRSIINSYCTMKIA